MKAADIIKQLRSVIPNNTALFSDTVAVTSLSFSAGIVTCVTPAAHGLASGDNIFINGALTPISITSLTCVDNVATAITASNHDFTDGYTTTVTIAGTDQSEYNGTHTFLHEANRRTFTFQVAGNPATPATGTNIYMLENKRFGYNGLQTITVVNPTTFTYPITSSPETPAQGTITFQKNIRISGCVTTDRIVDVYTKQPPNKLWMFVVLGATSASKDRFTMSDGTFTRTGGTDYRQRVVNPFSICVAAPCGSEIAALNTRDLMEDVNVMLSRAILNLKVTSPYSDQTDFGICFTGHTMISYNYSYYLHEFKYEYYYDLTYPDTINEDTSVAFRDLNFGFNNENGVEVMETNTNLDDVPLT